jgi:glutathione S-transferase
MGGVMPGPLTVYGSEISYFTGKFESYLRYKEIPYRYRPLDLRMYYWVVPRVLGATQYPSVQLSDGRWMSDTTPMILWLEERYPDPPILPADPVQRYLALLIEDYADGWLWRPAMHYRWSFADDRRLAASSLAREIVRLPLPRSLRERSVARRQKKLFVRGDGIDRHTRAHAEGSVRRAYNCLEPIFSARPFLLGERPTIADVGLMGPFWRHFVHDPTPARLLADTAPATYEWTARMWNARGSRVGRRPLLSEVPDDVSPLLREIGATHLEALDQNAEAHARDRPTHELMVQGTSYRDVPTSAYRVWCLERLRVAFERMPAAARDDVRALLGRHGCWEPLWRERELASGHDHSGQAPFCRALRMVRD